MKRLALTLLLLAATAAPAEAVVCARGVYRADAPGHMARRSCIGLMAMAPRWFIRTRILSRGLMATARIAVG
jgi:hypothetical protein